MTDPTQRAEAQARAWLRTKYNPTNDPIEHIEVLAQLLLSTEAAVLEEVIQIQCHKCQCADQYEPAVMEVRQWMHRHIRSKTWTLCDAGRIRKHMQAQEQRP